MNNTDFLFTLEVLTETIPYMKGLTLRESVFDIFKPKRETFIDKAKDIIVSVKDFIGVLIDTAQKWFNIIIREEDPNVDPLFRIAGGITFGSLILLVAALVYRMGKLFYNETKEHFYIFVTSSSFETVLREFGVKVTLTGEFSKEIYAYIVLTCLGLVSIIISKMILQDTRLKTLVEIWSGLQIAAAIYVFYYLYVQYASDENTLKIVDDKIMTVLAVLVGALGVLTGVTVTIPAIIEALQKGPSGHTPHKEHITNLKDLFDKIKDLPEALSVKDRIKQVYNKALTV